MTKHTQRVHPDYLKQLVPISQLTADNILDLMNNTYVETLLRGKVLFKKGDRDDRTYYLLAGKLELDDGNGNTKMIQERTRPARFPIDHHLPRQVTATAKTPIKYFSIDNEYLDILLTWGENASLAVSEITASNKDDDMSDGSDWMTNILRSKIFHHVPPGNIQALLVKMEPREYKEGDTVIYEGDEGDYYYYINKGQCSVSRVMNPGEDPTVLAQLAAGSSFGEEALISGSQRNATIKMLSDGELICLAKNDFDELLKAPVVKTVNYSDAEKMVSNGAVWLDVRLESEYKNDGIPEGINIPLADLRNKITSLAHDGKYIIYCGTGRRSASAAYLLTEKGIDACVLDGGLMKMQQDLTDE
ncbi:MAG: cyclic nucleotide-binding domain-containing protein [Gammaproteobacteria bacterium]|nr:cyclic nucleotide-binding domain-containing protein [Gammaproteobacteria bacterium]